MIEPIQLKKTAIASAVTIAMVASSTALAEDSVAQEESSGGLSEILVTSQFIEQNVQDIPIAITAMTGEQLEQRGHTSVDSIAVQSPNVTLTEGGGYSGPSLIGFIRGVGQTDFNPALEAGVGLYVDDVYYSQLSGSALELLDLERVEVLRGPQGTLAGKNSIGGAIKLYSKRPDEDANGYIETGTGSRNSTSLRAASNFTIAKDTLYARVSGTSRSEDGFVDRLDYNCANPNSQIPGLDSNIIDGSCKTGEDGGTDYTAVRAALRWIASDTLEVNLSAEKVKNKLGAPPSVLVGTYETKVPNNAPNRVAWNEYRELFVPSKGSYTTYSTYVDSRTNLNIPDEMHVESFSSTLNIDWQVSDTLQLQSITGYRDVETGFGADLDGSPIPILQQYQLSTHRQLSQEVRLNGDIDDFIEYTIGAFYFTADTTLAGRIDLGYSDIELDFIHGPDPVAVTNTALFSNTIIHPTETIDITLGLRYSTDEKAYTYHRHNPDGTEVHACDPILDDEGAFVRPDFLSYPNCALAGLNDYQPKDFEDKRMDYKAAIAWRATDNGMLYYQYSTGFKGGGVNPRPYFTVQAAAFSPEELGTHEVGAKWQLLDNILRINAAYFINAYKNIQLSLLDCRSIWGGQGFPCLAPRNAGDADVEGFELEIDYRPIDNWSLEASLSTLDFQYTHVNPATYMLDQYNEDGTILRDDENEKIYKSVSEVDEVTPFTPDLTWSISSQYDIDTSFGMISPRIDASYQSQVQTAATITEYGQIDERTLINVSITWLSLEEDWQARFDIRNLTDEYYYNNIADNAGSGHAYANMGKPKSMNLSLKHMF